MGLKIDSLVRQEVERITREGKKYIIDMFSIIWEQAADLTSQLVSDKVKMVHQSDTLILESVVGIGNRTLTEWNNDTMMFASGVDVAIIKPNEFANPYPFLSRGNITIVRKLDEPVAAPLVAMQSLNINFIRIIETN